MKKYAEVEESFCELIDKLEREQHANIEEIANTIYLGICGGTGSPLDTKAVVDLLKKCVDSDETVRAYVAHVNGEDED